VELDSSYIINYFKNNFPNIYLDNKSIPEPFIGSSKIKAIVLGADPSNITYNKTFKYVFGLENKDSQYFSPILSNLNQLNIDLQEAYVQNLIQNYFNVETSKNKKWFECALIWSGYLKNELDSRFSPEIPVLVTAYEILKVLIGKVEIKKYKAETIYTNKIIFDKDSNLLNRKLISLFRHPKYLLSNWGDYTKVVKSILN